MTIAPGLCSGRAWCSRRLRRCRRCQPRPAPAVAPPATASVRAEGRVGRNRAADADAAGDRRAHGPLVGDLAARLDDGRGRHDWAGALSRGEEGRLPQREGFSLSYVPFFMRRAVGALQEFPVVNSSFARSAASS